MKILVLLLLISSCHKKDCDNKVTIIEVGACTKGGDCITKLSNGEYETFYLPMKGQKVCP